ncbi:MAG: response regulator transcription factor [Rhizobacter sp.]|nr:response regulator transcription factor [Rhizobacter sp.]
MNTDTKKTRVLIVDDHPILRHGIAQLVGRESDFEACSEAGTVDEALEVLAHQPADVAIVDLSLEEQSGLELIRRAKAHHPALQCLVLSMHDERLHAERALRAGARGYLMKQEATRKIVAALRQVRAGRIYLSETVSSEILTRLASGSERTDSAAGAVGGLSDREMEVLRLIGRGLKTGEIARSLHRSVHTIETHRANIKRKLGLRTSGDLARAAFKLSEPAAC